MGTAIVGILLLGIIIAVIRGMIRDKKNGKSIGCGGNCQNCGGYCSRGHERTQK